MKIFKYLAFLLCSMCLSSAACDNSDDEDESADDSWSKYLNIEVLRCERVGQVLQIDFKITNKSKDTKDISINHPKVSGNDGTNYGYVTHTFGNSLGYEVDVYSSYASLAPNASAIYHIKVGRFSYPSTLKSVDVSFDFGDFGSNLYSKKGIKVTDNRIMSNGVQTNDAKLDYQVTSCRIDSNGDLVLNFNLRNNTGMNLEKVSLSAGMDALAQDNIGTTYNRWSYRWGISDWVDWGSTTVDIPQNGMVNSSIKVEKFSKSASTVTIYVYNEVSNYPVADYLVRFITIPVEI